MKLRNIVLAALLLINGLSYSQDSRTPLDVAKSIADRIIKETSFELKYVNQQPQLDVQIIDLRNQFNAKNGSAVYALSSITAQENSGLKFGISYDSPLKIFINDVLVFSNAKNASFKFQEIAYTIFQFQDTLKISLNKGVNKILIKLLQNDSSGKIYLRELAHAEDKVQTRFTPVFPGTSNWVYTGSFGSAGDNQIDVIYPPEKSIETYYEFDNQIYTWQPPKQNLLAELIIKEDAVYKRESYAEWMYPNGTVMFGLDYLAGATNNLALKNFVRKVCGFSVQNYELFKFQYHELAGLRSTNHRLYRISMLDDASAPALPFIQLALDKNVREFDPIIEKVLGYVSHKQVRLPDGTLCRPEPKEMTIWADDLFMSVPFLVRAAKLKNKKNYYDDAARQIINFNKYLFENESKLYKHAWLDYSGEKSVAFWGRANGWIVWATTEALLNLPANHKDYKKIKKIFADHIEGLIKVQNSDGMWHQVLDRKDSFEETSCTAMFIIGLARGIENGWISKSYGKNLMRAWSAIKERISSDGIVKDISRGTGLGYDLEFYFNRERFDNDPRGLGAVITAAVEVDKFGKFLSK